MSVKLTPPLCKTDYLTSTSFSCFILIFITVYDRGGIVYFVFQERGNDFLKKKSYIYTRS